MATNGPYEEREAALDDELLRRIRRGDQSAEQALFDRYYLRLVTYARRRMNPRLQRVDPPSEVAQSAMKSVLLGIPVREFDLREGESLWPLLITITLNKIRNRGKKYGSLRRDIQRNVSLEHYEGLVGGGVQDQTELQDLVEHLLEQFAGRRRQIVERLLDEHRTVEIAHDLGISERTVYNTRQQAIASLKELLTRAGPTEK